MLIRMTDLIGFRVDLRWRVAKVGRNWVPKLTRKEQKDFDKIDGHTFS